MQIFDGGALNVFMCQFTVKQHLSVVQACQLSIREQHTYLQVVGEPVESGVGVLHREEHVASRHDAALGDSFDPDRKATVVSLTHRHNILV